MLFFSKETNRIAKLYPNLFGIDDEDMEEESGDRGTETPDNRGGTDDEETKGFTYRWGWIYNVDRVSETMRISWNEAFKLNLIEFLNVLCYIHDKNDWERKQLEDYKRNHNLK